MKTAVRRPAQRAGELFPPPLPSAGVPARTHGAPAGEREAALPARSPGFTRRSIVATLAAAFAPAAGMAVVMPKVAETAAAVLAPQLPAALPPVQAGPIAESPELLALGAELEEKLDAYRAAAARLDEARAAAAALWPEPSAGIVAVASERAGRYQGCYEEEIDVEGNQWPAIGAGGGKGATLPRFIAVSGALTMLLDDVRGNTGAWPEGFERDLVDRIAEAEKYEDACSDAAEISDIEQAKQFAEARADDLRDLAHQVRKYPPCTIAGVMVHARALAAYADTERDGFTRAPSEAASILGRALAEAVLRVAGIAA